MKRSAIIGIAALVTALCVPLTAQGNLIDGIVKYEQPPDFQNGFDLQSQWDNTDSEPDVIKADDWICPDGRPITDIHWWGSYVADQTFTPDGFYIIFYDNKPMGAGPEDDLPGAVAGGFWVALGLANEVDTGQMTQGEHVYEYSVYLQDVPGLWFYQDQGVKYWLSIVADTPNIGSEPIWGWHTGLQPEIEGLTNAVTGKVLQDGTAPPFGNPDEWEHMNYNMAFAFTTVIPEPGIFSLVGFGALGLLALRPRKK
jgi:hypothetical protein